MKAGNELDALIADKVMGLKGIEYIKTPLMAGVKALVPSYSRDIDDAFEVVNKMLSLRMGSFQLNYDDHGWTASFKRVYAFGDSPAHVICLCALKAIGIEVTEEEEL